MYTPAAPVVNESVFGEVKTYSGWTGVVPSGASTHARDDDAVTPERETVTVRPAWGGNAHLVHR